MSDLLIMNAPGSRILISARNRWGVKTGYNAASWMDLPGQGKVRPTVRRSLAKHQLDIAYWPFSASTLFLRMSAIGVE